MTIEELIKQLKEYDPKLPVLLSGYEGGVYEANGTRQVTIAVNVLSEWYYGPHEIVADGNEDLYLFHERTKGVYIR